MLKRYSPREVFETDPAVLEEPMEICPFYSDGQEFVIDEKLIMPEGFCQSTWCSIFTVASELCHSADISPGLRKRALP